ncbi:MAG: hypothetical protein KGL39_35205 [Patescibacteria group bacterium]|nr:hypothetical protein [Patescibacteria group bacterium]
MNEVERSKYFSEHTKWGPCPMCGGVAKWQLLEGALYLTARMIVGRNSVAVPIDGASCSQCGFLRLFSAMEMDRLAKIPTPLAPPHEWDLLRNCKRCFVAKHAAEYFKVPCLSDEVLARAVH